MDLAWTQNSPYVILGYDKDADVYIRLAIIYDDLEVAIKTSDYMSTLGLKRKSNDEPFDWLEVVTEHKDIRHHVSPCI